MWSFNHLRQSRHLPEGATTPEARTLHEAGLGRVLDEEQRSVVMVAEPGFGYERGHAVADDLASDVEMRRDPYMTMSTPSREHSQIRRAPNSAGLYDVLDLILDKGIVIDAFVRVSLVGIELLTVDLRVVIASVDTYLRYAEGVERLGVYSRSGAKRLPDMVSSGMKTSAIKKGAETVGKVLTGGGGNGRHGRDEDYDEDDEGGGITGSIKRGVKRIVGKITGSEEDEGDEERDDRDRDRDDERRAERREPERHERRERNERREREGHRAGHDRPREREGGRR
jgi:hypothetical protein